MSVLVFAHNNEGAFSKGVLEACSYGKQVADKMGTDCHAVTYGSADATALGNYGVSKVHSYADADLDAGQMAKLVSAAADACGANVIICSHDLVGKAVAPRISARMKAGMVAGANALPVMDGGFSVKNPVFSGKAFAHESILTDKKVISLMPNSVPPVTTGGSAEVADFSADLGAKKVHVKETKKRSGTISLPDAELVVSAGRGLKGPENWGMIEELADALGAATACSRPVADIGWRPHHEHVGQTGVAIRPNLYIAIGISGAIQHLAGVNQSKTMVVINTDPEAPFFKAADYGVVGDAFEVVPRLTAAIKAFKG
jgi:electron transfer flavoprotein alpha subunit